MDSDRYHADQQLQDLSENNNTAGITIPLKDGCKFMPVHPERLVQVMQSINTDELNTLVCAITEAVEDPDERGFCQQ